MGIVTAVNDYFIFSENEVRKMGLQAYCKPILQKSSLIPSCLQIQRSDFANVKKKGKPAFLLALADKRKKHFPLKVQKYIRRGEKLKLQNGYKCGLRENWFHVPSVWASKGLFIKRSNIFPRILVNQPNLMVTDAFYRITMKPGYEIKNLAFSFMNRLSFIFAELEGRYYGGGVLEVIPSEFKGIPVPYVAVKQRDIDKVDKMLRNKRPLNAILEFTDELILNKGLKLPKTEIATIKKIYAKLVNRRLKL